MPSYDVLSEIQTVLSPETSVTIPDGATGVVISALGAGGSGGRNINGGGGGGGGGRAQKAYAVLEAEWGTTLSLSIGVGASLADGGDTTVDGTLNGAAITQLKGFGGSKGNSTVGGAGGTASGGDTNDTGDTGENGGGGSTGVGGSPPTGLEDDGFLTESGRGTGSDGSFLSPDPDAGGDGAVFIRWYY